MSTITALPPRQFDTLLTEEDISTFTKAGFWGDRLIVDYLDSAAAAHPDQLAIVDCNGELNYREFKQLVDRAALGFAEMGVHPGDTVSIQLPNRREWAIAHCAAVRVGAVTSPLIPVYRDREVGYMMRESQAKVLVTVSEFKGFNYPDMIARLRPELPELQQVLVVDAGSGLRLEERSWEEFISTPWELLRDPMRLAERRPHPNDVSMLMFTSGTTGLPKGAMHTHNTLLAASLPWEGNLGMDHTSVLHMASTFGHLTGYLFGVSLAVRLGATAVYQDSWSATEFVGLVERYGVQHTSGATPFLHDLIAVADLDAQKLSTLKRFCCMGAPIPRVYVEQAKQRLPEMSVLGGWGQTEDGLVTMVLPGDPKEKVTTTDGRALPGMEVRVVPERGHDPVVGEEGLLEARGPFLFQGYLGGVDLTRESFDDDWFVTGDLAVMDDEGYIRLSGRSRDVIVRGGENVPVIYVENVLYEHPSLSGVAVVGVPHPRLQETACAVVTLSDPAAPFGIAELRAHFEAKGVAKPYWPEEVVVLEELPRTPSGKIQKFLLRQRLNDLLDRDGGIRSGTAGDAS